MKFITNVLEVRKINEHAKDKLPSTCISLPHLHYSRKKHKYILGQKEHLTEGRPPRSGMILSSYPHAYLWNQLFDHQHKGQKQAITQNGTQIICASGRGMIYNLDTKCVLGLAFEDSDTQSSTKTPCDIPQYLCQIHCTGSRCPAQNQHLWDCTP